MSLTALLFAGLITLSLVTCIGWLVASRRHNLPCPAWLGWLVEFDSPLFRNHRAGAIIEKLDLQPGMRVLDAGCGPGRLTIPLAQRVGPNGEVVAIDLQTRMLERARSKARLARLSNVSFQQAKLGTGELKGGQFDRAVLVCVLGEIPNRDAALRELFQALRPGGVLSITEVIVDPHFQGRDTVRKLTSSAGFREKEFSGNKYAFSVSVEKPVVS